MLARDNLEQSLCVFLRSTPVKERDSGDISLCKQSRSHYQGLSKGGTLIERYLLMQRMVY